jgi:hypothetical protein
VASVAGSRLAEPVNLSRQKKRAAIAAARQEFQVLSDLLEIENYFRSSVGVFDVALGLLGVLVGASPSRIPSLKLFTPAPNPRIISGIFLPPKKSTITRRITSKCHGAKPSINHLLSKFPGPRCRASNFPI